MRKKNLEKYWMKKAEAYRDYCTELENHRRDLLEELRLISVGFTIAGQNISWSNETKLQDRASQKLKQYANLLESKKPKGYFYP